MYNSHIYLVIFLFNCVILIGLARTDYKKDQDSERLNFRETCYNFYGTKKMAEMGVFICIYEKL